jgi:hypothetical protein
LLRESKLDNGIWLLSGNDGKSFRHQLTTDLIS